MMIENQDSEKSLKLRAFYGFKQDSVNSIATPNTCMKISVMLFTNLADGKMSML